MATSKLEALNQDIEKVNHQINSLFDQELGLLEQLATIEKQLYDKDKSLYGWCYSDSRPKVDGSFERINALRKVWQDNF